MAQSIWVQHCRWYQFRRRFKGVEKAYKNSCSFSSSSLIIMPMSSIFVSLTALPIWSGVARVVLMRLPFCGSSGICRLWLCTFWSKSDLQHTSDNSAKPQKKCRWELEHLVEPVRTWGKLVIEKGEGHPERWPHEPWHNSSLQDRHLQIPPFCLCSRDIWVQNGQWDWIFAGHLIDFLEACKVTNDCRIMHVTSTSHQGQCIAT